VAELDGSGFFWQGFGRKKPPTWSGWFSNKTGLAMWQLERMVLPDLSSTFEIKIGR
jgi:hypothetical protein